MSESKETETKSVDPANNLIKEEIDLQLNWYLPAFFIIYFGSFLIPAIIFMTFIMLFYLPFFLDVRNFISLFTNLPSLIASLTLPLVIIIQSIFEWEFIYG